MTPAPAIYDAVVVGLGPAGASAAYEIAARGRSVLGLDGRTFPRYKVCGGGLSARLDHLLGSSYHDVVERAVSAMTFTYEGRDGFEVAASRPVAYFVMRARFDQALAARAQTAGACLQFGDPVLGVEEHTDRVRIRTARASYDARFVVGADGAVGFSTRRLNGGRSRRRVYGLEAEWPTADQPDRAVMEMGLVPGGYGWRFPKARGWSVGIAGFRGTESQPKTRWARVAAGQALAGAAASPLGHPVPIHTPGLVLVTSRIGLAGDAAHLVDPMFGEGIYYAVASGQALGRTIVHQLGEGAADLGAYRRWVETTLHPEFAAAARLADLAYTYPRLWFDAMRAHHDVVRDFYRILQGETGYVDLWARLKRDAWRLAPQALAGRAAAWFAEKSVPRAISS